MSGSTPRIISIGAKASRRVKISGDDVTAFGNLIKDYNPIHSSVDAAKAAGFPNPICYGMYAGSLFSGLMASDIPGPNTIYLSQNLRFTAPVFVGDEVEVTVEVREFRKTKGLIAMQTTVVKQDAESGKTVVCVEGSAVGMNKTVVFEGESEWTTRM